MANLIGTKPNQVPTNGSLGTMAFQDKENVSDVTFIDTVGAENLSLTAIAQTKAESAVDVFVYDTSKDSDGGAWRQRTQHTSWYNETLNTATRGSRKEFPAVAVIVAETGKVTIYDGDDPSMPMWMVFLGGVYQNMIRANEGRSISAVNGTLCNGRDGTMGLSIISFIKDYAELRHVGGNSGAYKGNISERNAQKDFSYGAFDSSLSIVNQSVNDVAMTVLPDAPIDQATGLPIPTIAVATDGGVSVIKDDGTVVDIGSSGDGSVIFTFDNRIAITNVSSGLQIGAIPNIDYGSQSAWRDYNVTSTTVPSDKTTGSDVLACGYNLYLGDSDGVTLLDENTTTPSEGMVAYTTSTYNTGWMNGDTKLATLSDTDDTDLVGSELVTNGTFDTDSDWITQDGWSISGGFASYDGAGALYSKVYQTLSGLTVGKTYALTFTLSSLASGASINFGFGAGAGFVNPQRSYTSTGTYTRYMTATREDHTIIVQVNNAWATVSVDDISVRLAEEDRSVNNNGLQVFGTVQKNPVATGADLVAYSGFTSSNYLRQPRNPDLDFGTGDFCVMGWVKPKTGATQTIASYGDSSLTSGHMWFGVLNQNTVRLWLGETGYDSSITTTQTVNIDTWNHLVAYRKSGVVYIFINGQLSTSGTLSNDFSNNIGYASVGVAPDNALSYSTTYYSLLRISGTAPTAEQIEKIYNDEKVLFQENAQATLYGTSDAVTALAYDTDTTLLHVGTSAGRSVFQGLRRVDNTTDAVGVAISASNNLVVEE